MSPTLRAAPPWEVERWFNTEAPLDLPSLRGKVIVLEAFQMLCPGCVSHGLPQAARVRAAFPEDRVAVVGLHTVFEHHAAMTPVALQAFLHEYRIGFPVGVDRAGDDGPVPRTMRAYAMQGTPTLVLIDARGNLRGQHFGQVGDLALGARIAMLLAEAERVPVADATGGQGTANCGPDGCSAPTTGL